jgi:hypothetical protein
MKRKKGAPDLKKYDKSVIKFLSSRLMFCDGRYQLVLEETIFNENTAQNKYTRSQIAG